MSLAFGGEEEAKRVADMLEKITGKPSTVIKGEVCYWGGIYAVHNDAIEDKKAAELLKERMPDLYEKYNDMGWLG